MSLDRFIQDFVQTNQFLGQHIPWSRLVLRTHVEDGRPTHDYSFTSAGCEHIAVGQRIALPDGEWYRIRLTHPLISTDITSVDGLTELRFDILRILQESTHARLHVTTGPTFVAIQLLALHRGRTNIVFVIEGKCEEKHKLLV